MNEPVDKKLISRIRQVFDHFEDPTAEAGWQELRQNFPERKRKPLILWLGSAAALLLLLTGVWISKLPEQNTIALKKESKTSTAAKPVQHPAVEEKEPLPTDIHREDLAAARSFKGDDHQPQTAGNRSSALQLKPTFERKHRLTRVKLTAKRQQAAPAVVSDSAGIHAGPTIATVSTLSQNVRTDKMPGEPNIVKSSSLVIKSPEIKTAATNQQDKPLYVASPRIESNGTSKQAETRKSGKQKLAFSIVAGSYFNFSEGSENQLNFGAGFLSDFRLGKSLKLSTGLTLASNSLEYKGGNDVPENAASSFDSPKAVSLAGSLKTITSMHASLLSLDIPVNLKYQFIPESDQFYFSAGLSSGTYLNETYNYQYRHFNMASGSYINQTRDQKLKQQFNAFDLAQTLNLSVGLSSGFGNKQILSIEPFVKYPLGGLGSEDIRFGSTGINLKLRFNSFKK